MTKHNWVFKEPIKRKDQSVDLVDYCTDCNRVRLTKFTQHSNPKYTEYDNVNWYHVYRICNTCNLLKPCKMVTWKNTSEIDYTCKDCVL